MAIEPVFAAQLEQLISAHGGHFDSYGSDHLMYAFRTDHRGAPPSVADRDAPDAQERRHEILPLSRSPSEQSKHPPPKKKRTQSIPMTRSISSGGSHWPNNPSQYRSERLHTLAKFVPANLGQVPGPGDILIRNQAFKDLTEIHDRALAMLPGNPKGVLHPEFLPTPNSGIGRSTLLTHATDAVTALGNGLGRHGLVLVDYDAGPPTASALVTWNVPRVRGQRYRLYTFDLDTKLVTAANYVTLADAAGLPGFDAGWPIADDKGRLLIEPDDSARLMTEEETSRLDLRAALDGFHKCTEPQPALTPAVLHAFPEIAPARLAEAVETLFSESSLRFCLVNSILHTAEISAPLNVLGSPFTNVRIHSTGPVNRILLGNPAFQQVLNGPGALLKPPKMKLDQVRAILNY